MRRCATCREGSEFEMHFSLDFLGLAARCAAGGRVLDRDTKRKSTHGNCREVSRGADRCGGPVVPLRDEEAASPLLYCACSFAESASVRFAFSDFFSRVSGDRMKN